MVKHTQLFKDSLFHPKKLAAFRVLSFGKVIQYVFLLITLVTISSFFQFITGISETSYHLEGLTDYIEDIKWLLYPFAFILLFLTTTLLYFIRISIYAFIGIILLKLFKRRGEYRHMWRTAAFAITWSTLLSIIFSIIPISNFFALIIGIIITGSILMISSTKYPKLPKNNYA